MKYCILGTGGIGRALMAEAVRLGHQIVWINHSGTMDEALPPGVSFVRADAAKPAELAPAIAGCQALFFCAAAPRAEWLASQESLVQGTIQACADSGVPLVYLDTLDAYGNHEGCPLSESSPEHPVGPQAQLRARLAAGLRSAINTRRITACIARSPDVFGPGCTGFPLGDRVFGNLVAGKPLEFLGSMEVPHSFIYVKDLARSLLVMADNETAWGKTWHLPCPQPVRQIQIRDMIRDSANKDVKFKTIGKGLFDPVAREMAEFMYKYDNPFIINHSRFSVSFGERTTPLNTAVFETLDWFKNRAGISRRYGF